MERFIRVRAVEPRDNLTAHVQFTNREERDIDLAPYIGNGPIFAPIRDNPAYFRSMYVDGGTIAWPNGADIDPDVLYYDLGPDATEEAWRAARASSEHTARS